MAWNQSVTRTRWLTVKLALIGLAAMAVTEALALMHAWWADPISKAIALGGGTSVFSGGRFSWTTFATNGITPLGYAAFAFALGTAAEAPSAVPTMAVTPAIFAAVQFVMPLWVRPRHPALPHGRLGRFAELAPPPDLPRPARRLGALHRNRQRRRAASHRRPGRLPLADIGQGRQRGSLP